MSRSPGRGSVTELGPGRFWARGPRPERRSLKVWPTRQEAQDVVDGAVELLAGEVRTRVAGVTVRAFGARVLAERAVELPRSAQAERSRWKRIERADFVDDALETLAAPAVDRWARALLHELPGSARCTLTLLSAICGRAVQEGLLTTNPCATIRLRPPPRIHEPWTYLLPPEQLALVAAPILEIDTLQIGALLGTGVRDGELFSLRLSDVHANAVDPFIVIRYGSPHGPPKGRKIRRVPLFGLGLRSVQRWLDILPTYCPENPTGLAFPGPRGGFQSSGEFLVRQKRVDGARVYLDDFREALAAAGIDAAERHDGRPVRAHDLRHTFAASLVSGWWGDPWRLEDICAVMGHSSITITQRYAHLAPGRVLELVSRTPGLHPGDASRPLRAPRAADQAPIALLGAGAGGTRCSSKTPQIHRETRPELPRHRSGVTQDRHAVAVDGLRAMAQGDTAGAERAALRLFCGGEPSEARLVDALAAVLTEGADQAKGA